VDVESLTMEEIGAEWVEVALIPTTMARTELANREIGWPFNLEADVLAKTIISYLERQGAASK
jgi:riboflavin synthase